MIGFQRWTLPAETRYECDCPIFDRDARSQGNFTIPKENLMKTLATVLLTSTFLVGGVYAQSPASPTTDASTHATMKSPADRNAEVEKHIADLHAKLNITPAEQSQWDAVAATMRDNANELDQAIDKREAHATAIEDLTAYGDVVQAHADGIKKLAKAFSSLYASMSDDQKKVADGVFVHHGHDENKATKH
jgi:hypothetical protein